MKGTSRLLFIVLLVSSLPTFGQTPHFQNYTLLRKNEPVQINTIFQASSGVIWIGTNKGIFTFDGLRYSRYTIADSLPDDNVTALAEDSLHRVWAGYKNGKLTYFQNSIHHSFETAEGSATGEVSDILFDKRGTLWFSTLNDGLYYFTNERLFRLDEEEGLPDLFIYDLEEDQKGRVWAGTDGGIAICTIEGTKAAIKVLSHANGLPDVIIKKIAAGEKDIMWLATEDAGMLSYNLKTGLFQSLAGGPWTFGSIRSFVIDKEQLWIATLHGLVVHDRKSSKTKLYNSAPGSVFTTITTLLQDSEGNVWTGSKTGLMRAHGDHLEYIESLDISKDGNVIALTIDHQDRIWFSNSEGLYRRTMIEPGKAKTEKMLVNTGYQNQTVISMFTDSAGFVWAGLYGEGVLRIDPVTERIEHLNKELRNGNILSIAGRGDVVWLATLGGGSKIIASGAKLEVTNFGSTDGLSTDYIYQVFMDSRGRVWFATDGKGVDMLDAKGFHHFQNGFTSKVVFGFAEDGEHTIWANVQGDGLYQFDETGFVSASKKLNLRDANISAFASDQSGGLVVMHDLGIDLLDTRSNKVHSIIDEAGIRDKKANLNAVALDTAGAIFFGTDEGIIKYFDRGVAFSQSPRPYISGVKVFDQSKAHANGISLKHNENDITISYLGLWYQNPQNLSYQYKLESYDRDWISSKDHSVTYSSLPSGDYVFHLKVSETDDFTEATETTLTFSISPPFWKTVWFYLICIALLAFAGFRFIRYRERRLHEDNRILEERVKERTLEIQQKTDEIQAQNEEIQAQAETMRDINENLESLVRERTQQLEKKNKSLEEYAFINAHELRAPVASILGLVNLMKTVELEEHEKVYLEHLQKSADKLDDVCSAITRAIEKSD